MASVITIRQAHLTLTENNDVYVNSADIQYSCQYELDTSDNLEEWDDTTDGVGYIYTYEYERSDPSYSWKFSDGGTSSSESGTHTFTKLTSGAKQTLTASITVTIKETVYVTADFYEEVYKGMTGDWVEKEVQVGVNEKNEPIYEKKKVWDSEAGNPIYEIECTKTEKSNYTNTISATDETATIDVYTRPGIFSDYNFSQEIIVTSAEGLTAEKVSNWCDHCGKFLSWKNQSDKYSAADDCKVSQEDWITAAWYNDCAELCGCTTRVSNDHSKSNSIITAQVFKDLGAAISKGNDVS